MLRERFY